MPLRPLSHDLLKSQPRTASLSAASQRASGPDARLFPEPDYLDTIDKLIAWKAEDKDGPGSAQASADDVADRIKKLGTSSASNNASKLLVCHDFKGGYTENAFERGYSFEFWHLVDTFIYFSHKRITLPPRGWVDAGHRHGSKVLGTVIFEWEESKPDLQKCLYGSIPQSPESSVKPEIDPRLFSTVCISQLIKIAKERNFDGYLVNVETDLNFLPPASCYPGKSRKERDEDAASMVHEIHLAGLEGLISSRVQHKRKERMAKNASVLSSWVGWLREEGKRLVGPHWEVIWYDSVTEAGRLRWQDALTEANALFFENSDAIFTNYTWARPPNPVPPGGLPEPPRPPSQPHPALLKSALVAISMGRSPADVYMGIDVFGRNCYGGYEIGRSLSLIFPSRDREPTKGLYVSGSRTDTPDGREDLGLSVALFAPGWTWEREKVGGGERSWSEWWMDELRFWFGGDTTADFPDGPGDEVHAISKYFGPRARQLPSSGSASASQPNLPPESKNPWVSSPASDSPFNEVNPDGRKAPPGFYTNFNRGSGCSWWAYGRKVYDASSLSHDPVGKLGWTDIGSSFPKPDRIWPRLVPLCLDRQATMESTKPIQRLDRTPRGKWVVDRAGLVDYEAWQGGSSLEIVFRPQQGTMPEDPTHLTSLTVLPLCTLEAGHITPPPLTVSLELLIKLNPNTIGNVGIHDLQLRPYLIWASDGVSEECFYHSHIPLSPLGSATIFKMSNGWYNSKATFQLSRMDTMQLAAAGAVVPVVALGLHLPRVLPPGEDLQILVGEISMSALPSSLPVPPPVSPSSVITQPSFARNLRWERMQGPRAASPTSLWGVLTWDDEDGIQQDMKGNHRTSSNYFNVFAFAPKDGKTLEDTRDSGSTDQCHMWLGTSTYGHNPNSFVVAGLEPSDLIPGFNGAAELASIKFDVCRVGVANVMGV